MEPSCRRVWDVDVLLLSRSSHLKASEDYQRSRKVQKYKKEDQEKSRNTRKKTKKNPEIQESRSRKIQKYKKEDQEKLQKYEKEDKKKVQNLKTKFFFLRETGSSYKEQEVALPLAPLSPISSHFNSKTKTKAWLWFRSSAHCELMTR